MPRLKAIPYASIQYILAKHFVQPAFRPEDLYYYE